MMQDMEWFLNSEWKNEHLSSSNDAGGCLKDTVLPFSTNWFKISSLHIKIPVSLVMFVSYRKNTCLFKINNGLLSVLVIKRDKY